MFSISEQGDLFIHSDKTITDYVLGNLEETNFRIARSRILCLFVHREFFKKQFIKHLRNNFQDSEIKKMIDEKLDMLFRDNLKIRDKIFYSFKNNKDKFVIVFLYKEHEEKNRNIAYLNIDC